MSDAAAQAQIEQGRDAYRRHAWAEAHALLCAADAGGELAADDLVRLAYCAYWTGRLDDYLAGLERAYRLQLRDGDCARAALTALMLQWDNRSKPAPAVASGWFHCAERLLDGYPDCVAHGYLAQARLWTALADGRLDDALACADRMLELGARLGDRDLHTLGLQRRGQVLVARGDVADGLALFEEAVVAAVSGELEAMTTAVVYCTAIASCHDLMEYGRATQWSQIAQRWCEREGSRGFPGLCRVYHAELVRLRGAWEQAERLVRQACEELHAFGALAMVAGGLYELGEIRRRAGDLDGAERAYRESLEHGSDCQPGLALLRLAQGDGAAAVAAIADALAAGAGAYGDLTRARLLAAQVEIALASGDVACARAAADELGAVAERYASTALQAEASAARAAVALAGGEPDLAAARRAHALWQELELPYEAARARLLVAAGQRHAGNEDGARMQLRAAASTFERLGAGPDRERALALLGDAAGDDEHAGAGPDRAPPLTLREREILTLVAAGLTNRQIAERLVLSPHTVHRHVANIRSKLRQPTRAATVAHAARIGLL